MTDGPAARQGKRVARLFSELLAAASAAPATAGTPAAAQAGQSREKDDFDGTLDAEEVPQVCPRLRQATRAEPWQAGPASDTDTCDRSWRGLPCACGQGMNAQCFLAYGVHAIYRYHIYAWCTCHAHGTHPGRRRVAWIAGSPVVPTPAWVAAAEWDNPTQQCGACISRTAKYPGLGESRVLAGLAVTTEHTHHPSHVPALRVHLPHPGCSTLPGVPLLRVAPSQSLRCVSAGAVR